MMLKEYLQKKYNINETKALAIVESGLVKVNGKYVNKNINVEGEVKVPSLLLSIGWEFFDLLKLSKKHASAFLNVKSAVMLHVNESEKQFFRLSGLLNGGEPSLLYASNLYPLDIQKYIKKEIELVVMKYTNNYEEFRFKKEILDEILKNLRFKLLDVFLSLYSYNQYVIYKKEQ